MVWGPHWPGDSLDIYNDLKQLNGIFCNIDPTPSWWYSSWLYTYLTVGLMGLNGCLNLMVDWMWLRARQWCIPLISQTIAKLKFISPLSYPLETPLCIMDTFHMLNFWTEIRCSQTIKTHTHTRKKEKKHKHSPKKQWQNCHFMMFPKKTIQIMSTGSLGSCLGTSVLMPCDFLSWRIYETVSNYNEDL